MRGSRLTVLLLLFAFLPFDAGADLQAGLTGSRLNGLTRASTIGEWDGTVIPSSGNLLDVSGENQLPYSDALGSWLTLGRVTVTSDSTKNPLDGTKNADTIVEDNQNGAHYLDSQSFSIVNGYTYTYSTIALASNRNWIELRDVRTTYYCFFNLTTGTVGTCSTASGYIQRIIGDWYRVWIKFQSNTSNSTYLRIYVGEADNDDSYQGLSQDSLVVYGSQVVDNTDGYIVGPGIYHPTTATTKPRLDLSPTGAPPTVYSHLQGLDGNRIPARSFDGSTQYYSRGHHDSMNVFDGNFTNTIVYLPDSAASGEDTLLCHGAWGAAGYYVEHTSSRFVGSMGKGAGDALAIYAPVGTSVVNQYHIAQVVNSSGSLTIYLDGTAGSTYVSTGYGVDGNYTLYLGAYNGGGNQAHGHILYTRLDAEALSTTRLREEREIIWGLLAGNLNSVSGWTFSRSTTAKVSFGTGGIRDVAINTPRVADGVLIEGQRTNLIRYSEAFNSWNLLNASVTPNTATYLAPDGTQTADILHEDATAAATHVAYTNLITLTAGTHTFSTYAQKINRNWIALYINVTGGSYAYFNVATGRTGSTSGADWSGLKIEPIGNGWYRCSARATTGAAAYEFDVAIGEADLDVTFDGLNQDSVVLWGGEIEKQSFVTSYCGPATTGDVTCTADTMTMDPHVASSTRWSLPETFCGTCAANKLTIEFSAKCEWSSSSDIGSRKELVQISGNTGTAAIDRNKIRIDVFVTGELEMSFFDNSSGTHAGNTVVNPVTFSNWNKYKILWDFSDLSRSSMTVNGSSVSLTKVGLSGSAVFDTTSTLVRLGQDYDGTISGFCSIKNLRVLPKEF